MSKLFEKLLLRRLMPVIEEKKLIPNHQFGFRRNHSTIDQIHRITNEIEKALEGKMICSALFLDISQAFDRVWHEGLIHKISKVLPTEFTIILKNYISERYFRVKHETQYSELKEIKAGVPQGSVLGPLLYLLYTYDFPPIHNGFVGTFADDTAILTTNDTIEKCTETLQHAVTTVEEWTRKWRIKLNEIKTTHINFTNKKFDYKPIYINNQIIPHSNVAKYLGITLDTKLRWKHHIKKKREELNVRYQKMYWMMGRSSSLSVKNKILIYKQVLRPIWTYGFQLWGCACQTNNAIIQRFQNKVLRDIVNAPYYIKNENIHKDLNMETVDEIIKKMAISHENRLKQHVNTETKQILLEANIRRLQRTKPLDLASM
jgi:hypothetical protein